MVNRFRIAKIDINLYTILKEKSSACNISMREASKDLAEEYTNAKELELKMDVDLKNNKFKRPGLVWLK